MANLGSDTGLNGMTGQDHTFKSNGSSRVSKPSQPMQDVSRKERNAAKNSSPTLSSTSRVKTLCGREPARNRSGAISGFHRLGAN